MAGRDLQAYLSDEFFADPKKGAAVARVLRDLQLEMPQRGEYIEARAGALFFSNHYGVVVRIELSDNSNFQRVNDSERILQPLGSVDLGFCVIEIVPGAHLQESERASMDLKRDLRREENISYWDEYAFNTVRLPPTPGTPKGAIVVGDRLAVARLPNKYKRAARKAPPEKLRGAFGKAVTPPQAWLYKSLQEAFKKAWKDDHADAACMDLFWRKVRAARCVGWLVPGWNKTMHYGERPINEKDKLARRAASCYEEARRRQAAVKR